MMRALFVMCYATLIGFYGWSQDYNSLKPDVKQTIDSTYEALIKKHKVIGTSIAIVKDGEIIYANGYGYQNVKDSIRADENTIYRIGSCTKSFTALSLMQLDEKEKLNVDNPIQDYVPEIKIQSRFTDKNDILIKDILTHSSGLPSDIMNGFFCDNPPNADWLIGKLNQCTMSAPKGYQHSYSNTGYGLLGKLIEVVTEQQYEAYVRTNIFEPLGMSSSSVIPSESQKKYLSKGYMNGKAMDETMIRDAAAGLIHSNVIDMAKYINMYLSDGQAQDLQLASSESIEEMEKDGLKDLVLQTGRQWGYGLYAVNISVRDDKDTLETRLIGHGGDTWAFHADFQYIPELNLGAVILTNSNTGPKISSAKRLLDVYLKASENKTVKVLNKTKDPERPTDKVCKPEDIIGQYHIGGVTINVKAPDKIKFRQRGAKIVMKPKNDSLTYGAKVKLFSLIPIKIKNQEFKFVEYDDQVYMKLVRPGSGNETYISTKTIPKEIPQAWQKVLGEYTMVGDYFECKDCPYMDFENLGMELKIENDVLVLKLKGKAKDTNRDIKFGVVSNSMAVSFGIGRNSGETLKIMENGQLFYSGFEFRKQP